MSKKELKEKRKDLMLNATPGYSHEAYQGLLHKSKIEEGLVASTEVLFQEALDTMKKKNADYSGRKEDMQNFRSSAKIANVKMSQGVLVRLMDKMSRIGNLIDKGEAAVKSETVYDTIQDAINYCAILQFALMIEEDESEVK